MGIAFRIFKDFQVAKKITKVAEIHHPREEVREIYDRIYKIFQEAYESLVPIYTQLQGRYCQKFYEN